MFLLGAYLRNELFVSHKHKSKLPTLFYILPKTGDYEFVTLYKSYTLTVVILNYSEPVFKRIGALLLEL